MRLRYAYNTNGASNHRLDDALVLIAEAGYDGVALTVDHHHFDPFAPDLGRRADALAARLGQLGLGLVVETGARFLLDFRHKHEPTLVSTDAAGRARRVEFLTRCLDLCAACGGEAVSFWAGKVQAGVSRDRALDWLRGGVEEVVDAARARGVVAALEPEPGMLVETCADWSALGVPGVKLALDLGHSVVTGEAEPHDLVRRFANDLATVSIEDMKRGVHEHLPFGQGDFDAAAALRALRDVRFDKLVCVELSRESPRAHEAVPEAIAYLKRMEEAL